MRFECNHFYIDLFIRKSDDPFIDIQLKCEPLVIIRQSFANAKAIYLDRMRIKRKECVGESERGGGGGSRQRLSEIQVNQCGNNNAPHVNNIIVQFVYK